MRLCCNFFPSIRSAIPVTAVSVKLNLNFATTVCIPVVFFPHFARITFLSVLPFRGHRDGTLQQRRCSRADSPYYLFSYDYHSRRGGVQKNNSVYTIRARAPSFGTAGENMLAYHIHVYFFLISTLSSLSGGKIGACVSPRPSPPSRR